MYAMQSIMITHSIDLQLPLGSVMYSPRWLSVQGPVLPANVLTVTYLAVV